MARWGVVDPLMKLMMIGGFFSNNVVLGREDEGVVLYIQSIYYNCCPVSLLQVHQRSVHPFHPQHARSKQEQGRNDREQTPKMIYPIFKTPARTRHRSHQTSREGPLVTFAIYLMPAKSPDSHSQTPPRRRSASQPRRATLPSALRVSLTPQRRVCLGRLRNTCY